MEREQRGRPFDDGVAGVRRRHLRAGFLDQRGAWTTTSTTSCAGNYTYHDEDSTYWDTRHNVVTAVTGAWANPWQASIGDNTVLRRHLIWVG